MFSTGGTFGAFTIQGGGKSFTVCSDIVALLPDNMMRRGVWEDREVSERDGDRGVEEGWEM